MSPVTISEMSSAATSLNASGSTGVGWPANAYAAHIVTQTERQPESDECEIATDDAHWRRLPKAGRHIGDVKA